MAVAARGLLRRGVFADSVERDTGILAIDLLLAMCCYLLGGVLTIAIVKSLGWETPWSADQQAQLMLFSQMAMSVPVVVLLYFRLHGRTEGWRSFGFNVGLRKSGEPGEPGVGLLMGAVVFSLVVVLALNFASVWIGQLIGYPKPEDGHETLKLIRNTSQTLTLFKLFAGAILAAPILEEVFYRGLVQSALLDVVGPAKRWTAILISAALFASAHLSVAQWQTLPGLMVFGVVLGWLYEKTGSLLPSIFTHMLFNAAMIGLMFLMT